tara:strand:- start:574 stop:828 length:255 start_codon:yes stop_codon:yes gene_type:complete
MDNKIKDDQLKQIKDQQTQLNNILHEIGVLESTKHGYLHQIAEVNREVETLKSELEEEYGAVNINLEDGTYTEIKEDVEDNKED